MTNPIQLLKDFLDGIKDTKARVSDNKCVDDFIKIKAIELEYITAIRLLEHFKDDSELKEKPEEENLDDVAVFDIKKNCSLYVKESYKNSPSYFAGKYNVSTTLVRNIVRGLELEV